MGAPSLVRSAVGSSSASAYKRKGGTGIFVKVWHEIATQPGVVPVEQFMDPKEVPELRIEGETVTSYQERRHSYFFFLDALGAAVGEASVM